MPDFFVVQTPEGEKLFVNLDCVSDAWYGSISGAPDEVRRKATDKERVFVLYTKQLIGGERSQNYFWWAGMDADIVQQEFLKAVRNPQPMSLVLLPAHG